MVNYDKNVQGAKREAAQKAYEAKVKAKQDKEAARRAEAKAKRSANQRQLLEGIAAELDRSEQHAYGQAYDELCEEGAPTVTDPQVLKFMVEHTDIRVQGISGERLADAFKQVLAPGEEELSFEDFLAVLRENAVADSTAVSKFLETCMGQDSIAKSEASAHALHVSQKMVTVTFDKEKWDVLLGAVAKDLGAMVSLQEFVQTCKRLARCARLLQYLEVEMTQDDAGPVKSLDAKSLKHWQDVAKDVSRRLEAGAAGGRGLASRGAPGLEEDEELRLTLEASMKDSSPSAPQLPAAAAGSNGGSKSSAPAKARSSAPQCDLCKASGGTCFYHAQRKGDTGTAVTSESQGASAASSSSSAAQSGASSGSAGSSAGASSCGITGYASSGASSFGGAGSSARPVAESKARAELDAAVAAGIVGRLEDAIVAAADAGVHEDDLLPAFARLEEFWQRSAVVCQ